MRRTRHDVPVRIRHAVVEVRVGQAVIRRPVVQVTEA